MMRFRLVLPTEECDSNGKGQVTKVIAHRIHMIKNLVITNPGMQTEIRQTEGKIQPCFRGQPETPVITILVIYSDFGLLLDIVSPGSKSRMMYIFAQTVLVTAPSGNS
jgi:hypothetical protein